MSSLVGMFVVKFVDSSAPEDADVRAIYPGYLVRIWKKKKKEKSCYHKTGTTCHIVQTSLCHEKSQYFIE